MNNVQPSTEPIDPTTELMKKLGTEILHDIQPKGLALFAQILRQVADHLDQAAQTHPDAPKT